MAFLKPALAKRGLSRIDHAADNNPFFRICICGQGCFNGPVNVIFDTDMCLDDDDGMALAIVHALHDRHEAILVAVTVGLDGKWCTPYASVLNTFYGHPDIPIGTIRNGLSIKAAWEKILKGTAWRMRHDVPSRHCNKVPT